MNILQISNNIAKNLNINKDILDNILENKIEKEQLNEPIKDINKLNEINKLLEVDSKIFDFEKNLKNNETIENFKLLKENLGKLQILVFIKSLEKSKDCNDILNAFIELLNNKFKIVNNILSDDLVQTGGGNINYLNKYIKYKSKYLKIKYSSNKK